MANKKPPPRRTCLECQHFTFDVGSSSYSEYEPSSNFDMACMKGVWVYMPYSTDDAFRCCLWTAEQCKQFEVRRT